MKMKSASMRNTIDANESNLEAMLRNIEKQVS
jgi:hypothetical protein